MRIIKVIVAVSVVILCQGQAEAQVTGRVYHSLGPVVFTNAAAWGFADGQLAGSNYVCGVYAGADSNSLTSCFGHPGDYLKRPLTDYGGVWLAGPLEVTAPAGMPIFVQFRAWPAQFDSYQAAVAASDPSPPVGVSRIHRAIPPGIIWEFPLNGGDIWLTPVSGSVDGDGDGLSDWDEWVEHKTSPSLADTDGDGMCDGQEISAGTDPKSRASALRITALNCLGDGGVTLQWTSVTNKLYRLNRSLTPTRADYVTVSGAVSATPPVNTFTDTMATNAAAFYWVELQ